MGGCLAVESDIVDNPLTSQKTMASYDSDLAKGFETISLHEGQDIGGDVATGSRAVPIYATTSCMFPFK